MNRSLRYCTGCENDFYNGNNNLGVRVCWSLKTSRVMNRWKVPIWEAPPTGTKVRTRSCFREKGFAMYDSEPCGNRMSEAEKTEARRVEAQVRETLLSIGRSAAR